MNRSKAIFVLLLMTVSLTAIAQTVPGTPDATVRFVSRSGEVLQSFEISDEASFLRVREYLQAMTADPENRLACVRIRAAASPDGNTDDNRARSDQRADDARIYLLSAMPELERVPFIVTSAGEDYETLRTLLEQSDIPGADRAAEIIRTVPVWITDASGVVVDGRKKQLMDLRGGQTWNAMRETIFPQLQRTRMEFLFGGDSPITSANDGEEVANDGGTSATDDEETPAGAIRIYFRVSDTTIRPEFRNNAASLEQLRSMMDNRRYVTGDIIRVVGMASPEGSERGNDALARRRAESIRKYIAANWPEFADAVSVTVEGEAWEDFRAAVQADTQLSEAESGRILDIIDSSISADAKEAALRKLTPWRRHYRSLFPDFRAASIETDFVSERFRLRDSELFIPGLSLELDAPALELRPDRLTVPALTKKYGPQKRTILAVKTNLLYDAATMLNYAIEIPIGDRFSLAWEHYFPWWVMRNNRTCVQYLTLGGEARWWFLPRPRPATEKRARRDRLVGHYLGVYGFWGKTDLQWDRIGCYQCENVWSAGLTYGYVFPISRHLNLELSASIGYASIPYQRYIPSDDWQILWRDTEGSGVTYYFGPTKLQVSLVWPIQITTRAREGARR